MKVVGKFFAIIFCIIYFFVLTFLMILAFAGNALSSNYYSDVFENIDLKSIKVSDLNGLFNEGQFSNDATLEDVLVEYFDNETVDENKVRELINNKEVKKTAGKVIGQIVSYAIGGEKPEITRKEIENFFESSVVTDVIGKPTEENIDDVYNQLNEIIEEMKGGINNGNTKRDTNTVEIYR